MRFISPKNSGGVLHSLLVGQGLNNPGGELPLPVVVLWAAPLGGCRRGARPGASARSRRQAPKGPMMRRARRPCCSLPRRRERRPACARCRSALGRRLTRACCCCCSHRRCCRRCWCSPASRPWCPVSVGLSRLCGAAALRGAGARPAAAGLARDASAASREVGDAGAAASSAGALGARAETGGLWQARAPSAAPPRRRCCCPWPRRPA